MDKKIKIKLPSGAFLLVIVLLYLKVSGHADIGWGWVFMPIWLLPVLFFAFPFIAVGIAGLIMAACTFGVFAIDMVERLRRKIRAKLKPKAKKPF